MKPTLEEIIRENIRTQAPHLNLSKDKLQGDESVFQWLTRFTHLKVNILFNGASRGLFAKHCGRMLECNTVVNPQC